MSAHNLQRLTSFHLVASHYSPLADNTHSAQGIELRINGHATPCRTEHIPDQIWILVFEKKTKLNQLLGFTTHTPNKQFI